jgi:cytochrome P450
MILNEVMRIFVVVPAITRVAREDTQLGEFFIPKGLAVEIAVGAMHKDARLWGEDVGKFNPDRFANGVANACSHPLAFLPFSLGPKTCIGNNFAVMEAKLVVAMVLRRFQLLPSPNYRS